MLILKNFVLFPRNDSLSAKVSLICSDSGELFCSNSSLLSNVHCSIKTPRGRFSEFSPSFISASVSVATSLPLRVISSAFVSLILSVFLTLLFSSRMSLAVVFIISRCCISFLTNSIFFRTVHNFR